MGGTGGWGMCGHSTQRDIARATLRHSEEGFVIVTTLVGRGGVGGVWTVVRETFTLLRRCQLFSQSCVPGSPSRIVLQLTRHVVSSSFCVFFVFCIIFFFFGPISGTAKSCEGKGGKGREGRGYKRTRSAASGSVRGSLAKTTPCVFPHTPASFAACLHSRIVAVAVSSLSARSLLPFSKVHNATLCTCFT